PSARRNGRSRPRASGSPRSTPPTTGRCHRGSICIDRQFRGGCASGSVRRQTYPDCTGMGDGGWGMGDTESMRTLNIPTTTHGRVLVREIAEPGLVLIGFHGYLEDAGIQMSRLEQIPGSERWTLVSVQGLHRFYR